MIRALAAAILLFAATQARADPVPAPQADADAPSRAPAAAAFCGQLRAADGQQRLNPDCLMALAFDPKTYFDTDGFARADALRPGGSVDAVFIAGRGSWRWAFAIDAVCAAEGGCRDGRFGLVLRVVTMDKVDRTPPEWQGRRPQTEAEMRRYLAAVANWREADLRTCRGATAALLALEDVSVPPFDDWTRGQITGHAPNEILVINDADTFKVRAGGFYDSVALQDSGGPGGAGAWAVHMLAVVRPCLKPASVPAPWDLPGR